jgi:hypothetical protein
MRSCFLLVLLIVLLPSAVFAKAKKTEVKNKPVAKPAVSATAKTKPTSRSTPQNSSAAKPRAATAGQKSQSTNAAAKKTTARDIPQSAKPAVSKKDEKRADNLILFAVSQSRSRSYIDPIVIIKDGKYTRPPAGDAGMAQLTRFANTYYREGQRYRLLFGGGEAGSVTIKQWNLRKECSRTEADAEIDGDTKIGGKVMGLATNSQDIGNRSRSRRFPTEHERSAAESLIKKIFKQKGVTDAEIKEGFAKVNLTAADLNGDKRAELIGTYLVKRTSGGKTAHILFTIIEPDGSGYKVGTSQYGQITAKDVGSEAMLDELGESALAEILVDQIDLNRDGTAEVIIADLTKEGVVYKIFRKDKKGWQRAYEFANYRCTY